MNRLPLQFTQSEWTMHPSSKRAPIPESPSGISEEGNTFIATGDESNPFKRSVMILRSFIRKRSRRFLGWHDGHELQAVNFAQETEGKDDGSEKLASKDLLWDLYTYHRTTSDARGGGLGRRRIVKYICLDKVTIA